jgi:galactokinase
VPEIHADAPGRVNLIGEHTDYQDGFVLPCAVPQRTYAALEIRSDRRVRAWSTQVGCDPVEYALGEETRGAGWVDYIQGVTWVLAERGLRLRGFDLRLRSDVPVGSGLASSAALEVATLRAIRTAFELPLSDVDLAKAAQRAETDFVGAPVGIMDQMASSLAGERDALFLDTRSLQFERIPSWTPPCFQVSSWAASNAPLTASAPGAVWTSSVPPLTTGSCCRTISG